MGTEAIYTAATRSLAALEVLVHFAVLPLDFVLTEIAIPDDVPVLSIEDSMLPEGWADAVSFSATQAIGAEWVSEGRYGVLSVPSSVVREERNYVLNPKHPDFQKMRFSAPRPFRFDPRLK